MLNSFRGAYYEPNKKLLNRALYTDRALYTPDVVFENDECTVKADIITCAAPNKYAAQKYQKVSDEENEKVLINRLLFIRDIVADQGVDTLILGAFGCGVFGQDPRQVAELMDEIFGVASVENIVYAVPGQDETAMVFERHFFEK